MFKQAALHWAAMALASTVFFGVGPASAGPIQTKHLAKTDADQQVDEITLTNNNGSSARLINYGAIVTHLLVPDKNGQLGDVVLGFDEISQYAGPGQYMGSVVGRYGNRIANGLFTLHDHSYALTINNSPNSLHGGMKGYANRIWNYDTGMSPDGPMVRFTLLDPDGTEGYPGNLKVTVLYTLTQTDALKIQYYAVTDAPTVVNLTHHGYFNLRDGGKSDVLNHVVKIYADHYTPVDATLIPTGEIASVEGTPFDFRKAKLIGKDIKSLPATNGYDHNLVLNNQNGQLAKAADVYEPDTGRLMEVWTTEPGLQFYTANYLSTIAGKNGDVYGAYHGFCMEAQHYPDSPHRPDFPTTTLLPGQVYRQITEYRFSIPATPLTPE